MGNSNLESVAPPPRYAEETATSSQGQGGSGSSQTSSEHGEDGAARGTYSERVDAILREQYKYLEKGEATRVSGEDVKSETQGLQRQQDENIRSQGEPMPNEQVDA